MSVIDIKMRLEVKDCFTFCQQKDENSAKFSYTENVLIFVDFFNHNLIFFFIHLKWIFQIQNDILAFVIT